MTDPLARWWRHEVIVEPFLGSGAYGDKYGPEYTALAAIDDRTRQVVNRDGVEVVSQTTVVFPRPVGYIQPGSRITLPATHGGRTSRVIACRVADGGGQPTPDHVEVNLE